MAGVSLININVKSQISEAFFASFIGFFFFTRPVAGGRALRL